jgi:hypothetical protein
MLSLQNLANILGISPLRDVNKNSSYMSSYLNCRGGVL